MGEGTIVREGIAPNDTSKLTAEERWGVVWSAVMAYYSVDALFGLVLSLVGMIALAVSYGINKNQCDFPFWIPATIAFLTRVTDVCIGGCSLCFSGPPTHQLFGKYVKQNLRLSLFQTLVGIGQVACGVVVIVQDDCSLFNGILACIFGALFIFESGTELCIWILGYHFWKIAQDPANSPPEWVDAWISDFFKRYLRNGSPFSKKTNRTPMIAHEV